MGGSRIFHVIIRYYYEHGSPQNRCGGKPEGHLAKQITRLEMLKRIPLVTSLPRHTTVTQVTQYY
jgi:hypothetical protein